MRKEIKKNYIGVSGDKGSFSEEAAILYSAGSGLEPKIVYLIDMEGVLSALNIGTIDLGIFPVVNSRGGLVHPAFKAMGKYKFKMIDEVWLDVKQNLLSKKDMKKSDIKAIASHSQALAQCERYLEKEFSKIKLIEWEDTAKAARDLATGKLNKNVAVIAPARCAQMYNLQVLDRNIQDTHPNLTTFIVVKKINLEILSETVILNNNTLQDLRRSIEKIDNNIIKLLSMRFKIAKNIGILKQKNGLRIVNHDREKNLMNLHHKYSQQNKIDEKFIDKIFNLVIKHSRTVQKKNI